MATEPLFPRSVQVRVEVPRGSFAKRSADGRIEFLSPIPCPFHYGSVVGVMGSDGDAQDAVIIGRRAHCPRGSVHRLPVRACVRFIDEGLPDDKWICSDAPLSRTQELALIAFFCFYGLVKATHDRARGARGATGYKGFTQASER